jgi:Kelch motif/RTX calcium-binding nonapeptide repeat (4 copies)
VIPRLVACSLAIGLAACATPGGDPRGTPQARARAFEWHELSLAPSARTEVAAAVDADGRIVVAGGFDPDTVATVEIYDPSTDRWVVGPSLPIAVHHAMAAAVDGVVHVFGGYTSSGDPSDQAFALRGDSWEALPVMPEGRAAGGAAAAGGHVYIAGGVGPSGLAASTLIFDPATAGWTTGPALLRPREHLGVAAVGSRVYVVGGRTASGNLADAEVFEPATGEWRRLPDMPTPRGGLSAAGTANGFVVAPGGEDLGPGGTTFPEVEALDVERERWVSLPSMPSPRHGLGVVAIGDTVYTIAGGPTPGLSSSATLEAIDLAKLDTLECLRGAPTTVGTPSRDLLSGSDGRDVIASLGGPDAVKGGEGADLLCGGGSEDRLAGGPGKDRLHGGAGRDRCREPGSSSRRLSCER